jgi:hypothetical protein
VISGFRREIDYNCFLLGYYAANSDNFTDVSGKIIGLNFLASGPLKMGPIGCPELSARNYHFRLHNN